MYGFHPGMFVSIARHIVDACSDMYTCSKAFLTVWVLLRF
jgi:hypothetical protein